MSVSPESSGSEINARSVAGSRPRHRGQGTPSTGASLLRRPGLRLEGAESAVCAPGLHPASPSLRLGPQLNHSQPSAKAASCAWDFREAASGGWCGGPVLCQHPESVPWASVLSVRVTPLGQVCPGGASQALLQVFTHFCIFMLFWHLFLVPLSLWKDRWSES